MDVKKLLTRYRYTFVTAAFLLLTMPPFLLTTYRGRLEPYPALLLPASAYVTQREDDSFVYQRRELLARPVAADTFATVPLDRVFSRVRATRMEATMRRAFGLDGEFSEAQKRKTRAWLRRRLHENGYAADSLYVRRSRTRVNVRNRGVTQDSVLDERLFRLD